MSERDDKRGGMGVAIGCLLILFLVLPLYVLSIGPAAMLVNSNESFVWVTVIYYPIGLLAEHSKSIGDALNWYVGFWV